MKRHIALRVLLSVILVYITASCAVYAFKHPELTDTQRLINFFDAILWR